VLTMESAVVRAEQAVTDAPNRADVHQDLARLIVADRVGPAELIARSLAATVADGDDARMLQSGTRRLLRGEPLDRISLVRRVAAHVTAAAGYPA